MKKIIIGIVGIVISCVLFGCDSRETDSSEEYARWNQNAYGYLTEDGYFFTSDSSNSVSGVMLYYFDRTSGKCVPVCDKAECDHRAVDMSKNNTPTCNAQFYTYDEFVVYKDKIFYIYGEDKNLCLRKRDTDGNNDAEVAKLNASQMGGQMWFYRDYAFLLTLTDVSGTFDPESRESDESVIRFYCVDLKTGETKILGESSMISAVNYAFNIYQMEKGKVCYYDLEGDSWYVFDTENAEVEKQTAMPKRANYGEVGEYIDLYRQYCYGCFEKPSEETTIMRLDRNTGEEIVIYTGNSENMTGYVIWGNDQMFISEVDRETYEIKKLVLYDMETGKMKQLPNAFCDQEGMLVPVYGDKHGIVYFLAENDEDSLEYCYASVQDIMDGNGIYTVVDK